MIEGLHEWMGKMMDEKKEGAIEDGWMNITMNEETVKHVE